MPEQVDELGGKRQTSTKSSKNHKKIQLAMLMPISLNYLPRHAGGVKLNDRGDTSSSAPQRHAPDGTARELSSLHAPSIPGVGN